MKEKLLIWTLLIWQITPNFSNWSTITQEISDNFLSKKEDCNTYQTSWKEIIEVLENHVKKQIIEWTVFYFNNHTTANLNTQDQTKLRDDIESFLKQYPNIITISWNKVFLNLDENIFLKLFTILLPYFSQWDALKNYPRAIKNNETLILNHIKKSKWDKANHYCYRFFWYLIMDIVNEINKVKNCDMTIWEYKNSMLKWLYIPSIANQNLPKNISDDSIKNLSKYFQ